MLKNDKKRAEYDRTYKPTESCYKYDKNKDPNSFKFDYNGMFNSLRKDKPPVSFPVYNMIFLSTSIISVVFCS